MTRASPARHEDPGFSPRELQRRRDAVARAVGDPVVLGGHRTRDRNLPGYGLPFRQDSNFLYLTGCGEPGAAAILVEGALELYLPVAAAEDALWHGPQPSLADRAAASHAARVAPFDAFATRVGELAAQARLATVATADPGVNAMLSALCGVELRFGQQMGDPRLAQALWTLRRRKSGEEVAAMRAAVVASVQAHLAVAALSRPGAPERSLVAAWEAICAAQGMSPGYDTILTRRGEVLHHHGHDGTLASGDLLLVDAGAELGAAWGSWQGYGADLTRTWPVGGWQGRARAAYEVVLAAWNAAVAAARPGVRYRALHDAAAIEIASFLCSEGIVRVDPDDAVAMGLHGLFFPHGVGHLLGLDVHDLESFGDVAAYEPGAARPRVLGSRSLRLDLLLEPGHVVTIEPGFYAVPAILMDRDLRSRWRDVVDWSRAEAWTGLGGIRIEDDVLVTRDGVEVLSGALPRRPQEVEAMTGRGLDLAAAIGL